MDRNQKGFTLIEVMIVVSIIAIIAVIAFPAYDNYVTRARRADGKSTLMEVAQKLERCYTQFNAYNNGSCSLVTTTGDSAIVAQTSDEGFYQVTGAITATTFALTATPQGAHATEDTDCANLTLTHLGAQGASGSNTDRCW